jgi:hypothetical protein
MRGWCGACERSASAAGPASPNRVSHLWPVFSLMPTRRQMSMMLSPGARCSTAWTNSRRCDMTVWGDQGIGLLRVKPETCTPAHPSSRSATRYGSPIIPVRTSRWNSRRRVRRDDARARAAQSSKLRAQSSELRAQSSKLRAQSSKLRVQSSEFSPHHCLPTSTKLSSAIRSISLLYGSIPARVGC